MVEYIDPYANNPYIAQMEAELQQAQLQNTQMKNQQLSMFGMPNDQNIIEWQLDLKEEMDRIYHLLRGDIVKEDKQGNIIYEENKDATKRPFNDFGVQLIMNIMSFYLNRNTLLSNYDEETINFKVLHFGQEISDLILCRYEEMGMDTSEKIKLYPMIIRELKDTVHSAYLRALDGGERDSLRTARTISQNENIGTPNGMSQPPKKFSIFKPTSWI